MWRTLLVSLATIAAAATDRQSKRVPLPEGRTLAIEGEPMVSIDVITGTIEIKAPR